MPSSEGGASGSLAIEHLFRHPEQTARVAAWIHGAFWTQSRHGVEFVEGLLREAKDPGRIPLSFLAFDDGIPAGTVQLIRCDSKTRPDLTPWLAALFVDAGHRERGIASSLVRHLVTEAARLGCTEMFLETDIPDFYARLGAVRYQTIPEGGWIMRIPVDHP